jgi:hypothetical protein
LEFYLRERDVAGKVRCGAWGMSDGGSSKELEEESVVGGVCDVVGGEGEGDRGESGRYNFNMNLHKLFNMNFLQKRSFLDYCQGRTFNLFLLRNEIQIIFQPSLMYIKLI